MNYPWDILGVETTKDKKAIKKAYAALLRKYRPDSHPEEFQEINQAYQYALSILEQQDFQNEKPESINNEPAYMHPESDKADDNPGNLQTVVVEEDAEAKQSEPAMYEDQRWQIELAEEILEEFHQMAFAEYGIKKKKKNWNFLSKYHELEDFGLRESLSHELFKRLVEYNHFQQKENGTLLLNQPIARIIAEHLNWETEWLTLNNVFPPAYSQHVFSLLEDVDVTKKSAPLIPRMFGVYLEVALINVAMLAMGMNSFNSNRQTALLALYVFSSSLFSLTKLNLPLIQYFFDLRLFDKYMNKPTFNQKIVRLLAYHISMIPVYILLLDSISLSPWSEISLSLVFVANLITWVKTKQFFHDWVSGTIVLK